MRIHPKVFDHQTAGRIAQEIEQKNVSPAAKPAASAGEKQHKNAEIPDGFIKECRQMPGRRGLLLNQNGQREKGKGRIGRERKTVGFLIEIIAPTADGLRQNHAGNDDVQHLKNGQLPFPAEQDQDGGPRDQPSVNGQAALPDIQGGEGIVPKNRPGKEDIVSPRAEDPCRKNPERQVQDRIPGHQQPPGFLLRKENREGRAQDDQQTVP